MHLSHADILALEQRKRAQLINSITGTKNPCLIGTVDDSGQTNLAIFNSIIHLGAHPPLIAFVQRPDSVARHTFENIVTTQFFTINHIHGGIAEQAHQTSARYDQSVSEFEAVGLKEDWKQDFPAPFVQESRIQLGCKLAQVIPIDLNNTKLVIGEIQQVFFPEKCWEEDGYLDIELAGTIAGSGLDGYHELNQLFRLSYAKPNEMLIKKGD